MEKCCEDLAKRDEQRLTADLVVSVCKTCGRRHFELTVDPGKLEMRVS